VTHRVLFRPNAEHDLLDLYAHIAADAGLARAGTFIDRIEAACLGLERFPERGNPRDDLLSGVRLLNLDRRVAIAYRVSAEEVTILRIFYAGRDYEAALSEEP
jgi:toxin ParE1/3/4